MKIEHIIYIGVVMMLLTACGSYRKSAMEDLDGERRALALSEMSGIGVVHGNARMSEGVSVTETEVYYSAPDSAGRQHVKKTVTRRTEAKREADAEVVAEDSVVVTEAEVTEETVTVKVKEEKERKPSKGVKVVSVVLLVGVGMWMWKLAEG